MRRVWVARRLIRLHAYQPTRVVRRLTTATATMAGGVMKWTCCALPKRGVSRLVRGSFACAVILPAIALTVLLYSYAGQLLLPPTKFVPTPTTENRWRQPPRTGLPVTQPDGGAPNGRAPNLLSQEKQKSEASQQFGVGSKLSSSEPVQQRPSGQANGKQNKTSTPAHSGPQRYCDGATRDAPCIFDMGLNLGQSSAYYLRDPRARVLAVEANPLLAKQGLERFSVERDSGSFRVLHVGVAPEGTAGPALTFWVNTKNSKFSSFHETVGCRYAAGVMATRGDHTLCYRVQVPTRTCSSIIREHGTPSYMKVDIEGYDWACLASLKELPLAQRPKYVSKENLRDNDLETLLNLGYTRFKVVNQALWEKRFMNDKLMRGTSGDWGEKAQDIYIGTNWHSAEQLRARLPLPKDSTIDGSRMAAWYDLHAAL